MMNSYEENELLHHLIEGDQKSLTSIFNLYAWQLFISAYNILRDKEVCQSIIQDIFLELWKKRESLQRQESLKGYLFAATRYQVFYYISKKSARPDLFDDIDKRLDAFHSARSTR